MFVRSAVCPKPCKRVSHGRVDAGVTLLSPTPSPIRGLLVTSDGKWR